MSDDDTRELPPVGPGAEDRPEAAAAQGAGATAGTTEEDETVTIERTAPKPPKADDATAPLPKADDATVPLPKAETPTSPPPAPTGLPPRADPAADAYAAATGHIRVVPPSAPVGVVPAPGRRPTLRVGTVVWGLVVAAFGVGLLSVSWGAHLDTELAFIVLLGAAGVALLVGSLVGMRRSRNRLEGRG